MPDVTGAILAGERAANSRGAQDVRTLFSVNGGRTLQPFEMLIERTVDPLQVYVAVRQFNYWAEGFALLSRQPLPDRREGRGAAAGRRRRDQARRTRRRHGRRIIETGRGPTELIPVTDDAWATSLGWRWKSRRSRTSAPHSRAGEVYSLKIGLTDGADQHAIVSAMIAVREGGSDVLWTAGSK